MTVEELNPRNRAPSRNALRLAAINTIKLECSADLLIDVWKARGTNEIRELLVKHDKDLSLITQLYTTSARFRHFKMALIDALAGFSGVEFLGVHRRLGGDVHYLNAGDTYAATLIFHRDRMLIGTWGDWVERKLIVEFQQP